MNHQNTAWARFEVQTGNIAIYSAVAVRDLPSISIRNMAESAYKALSRLVKHEEVETFKFAPGNEYKSRDGSRIRIKQRTRSFAIVESYGYEPREYRITTVEVETKNGLSLVESIMAHGREYLASALLRERR